MFLRIFPAWNFHKVFTEKKLRECVRVCMCEPQECGKETKKPLSRSFCAFFRKNEARGWTKKLFQSWKKSIVSWCCVGDFFPFYVITCVCRLALLLLLCGWLYVHIHAWREFSFFPSTETFSVHPSQKHSFLHPSCLPKKKKFFYFVNSHTHNNHPRAHTAALRGKSGIERERAITRLAESMALISSPFMLYRSNCSRLYDSDFRLGTIFKGRRRRGGFPTQQRTQAI